VGRTALPLGAGIRVLAVDLGHFGER